MKSLEELRAIREKMPGKVGVRAENENQIRVVVGMATCGIASGARNRSLPLCLTRCRIRT